MARPKKVREGAGKIPVDSFSDLAFLLIIFFVVTMTLERFRGFSTDLPSGEPSAKQEQQQDKRPTVMLKDGTLTLNGTAVSTAQLADRLREMDLKSKRDAEKVVIFEPVGGIRYQEYFSVMAIMSSAGASIVLVKEGGK